MKACLVKIEKIKCDEEIYPRLKVGWLTAFMYAQAMRAKSIFPPILLGTFKQELYLVDGWHRVEAHRILGEKYIRAAIKPYESKRDMFIDAVKLNVTHGRPISPHEKVRIIDKLEAFGFQPQEISELVLVPMDKISVFTSRIITNPDGSKVYLKSIVAKTGKVESDVYQNILSVRNIGYLLSQLLELLRADLISVEEENNKKLLVEIYSLIGEKLRVTTVQ